MRKVITHAESQYKTAWACIRELSGINERSDQYAWLEDSMHVNCELKYIKAARYSHTARATRPYELRPMWHRSANPSKIWEKMREWSRKQGHFDLLPSIEDI